MASKATPKIEGELEDMLKAAAVMPDGLAHCTEQSGLIFDQYNESLSAAELELSEAQKEFDRLSRQLDDLRRERRKYDDRKSDVPTEEEQSDEQATS